MDREPRWVRIEAEIEFIPNDRSATIEPVVQFYPRLLVDGRRFADVVPIDRDNILDVAAFFESLREPGRVPLFTCICGNFGCGGCWTDVVHTQEAWGLRNAYDPLADDPASAELIEAFELAASWTDVWAVAATIDGELERIRALYTDQSISNGFYGVRLDDIRLESADGRERTGG